MNESVNNILILAIPYESSFENNLIELIFYFLKLKAMNKIIATIFTICLWASQHNQCVICFTLISAGPKN